jgi:hypothetical protein
MTARSGAPTPAKPAEYDQEIKDMADYIHNYKIDSDLAVSVYHVKIQPYNPVLTGV